MSFRFYPIYQIGNPQLRVYLPNFWMKLVQPTEKQPPNVVQFKVPLEMTDYDIRNYLEKIYNVKVMHVKSEMEDGKTRPAFKNGYIVKDDDFRRAYVTLPRDETFTFPDLDPEEVKTKDEEELAKYKSQLKSSYRLNAKQKSGRFGLPTWFST